MRRRLRGIATRVAGVPETGPSAPTPVDVLEPDPDVDPVLAAAVDLARRVARETAGQKVGPHLGVEQESELVVTHSFASNDPAYVGWRWAVTVASSTGSTFAGGVPNAEGRSVPRSITGYIQLVCGSAFCPSGEAM